MKYLFVLLFTMTAWAQHAEQPLPEDTEDARANYVVFELKDIKNNKTFSLERSPYYDHFLRLKKKKGEMLQKADSRLAKTLDGQFTSTYLKTMYEIPEKEGKCQTSFELVLKGEKQQICQKDDKKTQMIKSFIELLEKHF